MPSEVLGKLSITDDFNTDISIVVAGFLFGLAHFADVLNYVFLSIIAGCIYGYAYKTTGRIEAPIVTHFLLNIGHFLFFSYPYLSY